MPVVSINAVSVKPEPSPLLINVSNPEVSPPLNTRSGQQSSFKYATDSPPDCISNSVQSPLFRNHVAPVYPWTALARPKFWACSTKRSEEHTSELQSRGHL